MTGLPTTWRRSSLRARLTSVAVLGVAVALALGSVVLYGVLTVVGYRTLDDAAAATAQEVAALVDSGRLPDPIPVTGRQVVQVLDSSDRVVSASVDGDRLTAVLLPRERAAALAGGHPVVPGSRVGLDSPLRVTAVTAGPDDDPSTVVVAQQYDDLVHSQRVLRLTLLATYPLLLVVLGLFLWRVVHAVLRPVEELRATADRISGGGQDTRLPVPASRDEVHDLAVTLNSMLDRLAAGRARQRSFVADAAHELRSPLASMRTQLEVAEHLGEDTAVTRDLQEEVARMARLVEDLLVLARLDRESPLERPAGPVDVQTLVTDAVRRRSGSTVAVTTGCVADADVLGHEDHVRRALDNLLDNGMRHARSSVEVTVTQDADAVVIEVADDGDGIAPQDRDRVFDRFTRLDEARDRDAGGSGLGLAIVRELVHREGGRVVLDESSRGGLLARVVLPRAAGPRSPADPVGASC